MNRRTFLTSLFSAGVALAAAPTLLSLVPTPAPIPVTFDFATLTYNGISEEMLIDRYIRPAAAAMAQDIEDRCAAYAYQAFGTPFEVAA